MKAGILVLLATGFVFGCGGSLNDEQRRQLREGKEQQAIKKISEAEIFAAALQKGRTVVKLLSPAVSPSQLDSIGDVHDVQIRLIAPQEQTSQAVEHQLIEAYLNNLALDASQDNLQKVGGDSLLYTKPVIEVSEDSVEVLKGMWSIWLSQRNVILSMDN